MHTPGPWRWLDYPDGRKLLIAEQRAVIHNPDALLTILPADMRLIAASPDLLAACLAMLSTWGGDDEDEIITTRDRARAAVTRAIEGDLCP